MLDGMITQQAALIAYLNDFKLLMFLTLAMVPLVMLIAPQEGARRTRDGRADPRDGLIATSRTLF